MADTDFSLLIGKRLAAKDKGKDKPDMSEDDEMPSDSGDESSNMEDSAVSDLMSAISSKDVQAAKNALKDFLDLQASQEEPQEEEAPPPGMM